MSQDSGRDSCARAGGVSSAGRRRHTMKVTVTEWPGLQLDSDYSHCDAGTVKVTVTDLIGP